METGLPACRAELEGRAACPEENVPYSAETDLRNNAGTISGSRIAAPREHEPRRTELQAVASSFSEGSGQYSERRGKRHRTIEVAERG